MVPQHGGNSLPSPDEVALAFRGAADSVEEAGRRAGQGSVSASRPTGLLDTEDLGQEYDEKKMVREVRGG